MYSEHFQLTEPPFRLSPDPQFLYASRQHARAKAYMDSIMWLTDGFVVITGEIGSGKTTLIQSFISELPEDVALAHIAQTQVSPVEFLQAILVEFGFRPFSMQKAELLDTLNTHLIELYASGRKVLLIIDEAQNLSPLVLEELRLLSGVETQKEKVLRIILAGQPELKDKLDSPRLEQLAQRVRLRFHLGPLNRDETTEYVRHRLRVAGAGDRELFSEECFALIYRHTLGTPRLVNTLCDTAMLCAFADDRETVDAGVIEAALQELQWHEHPPIRRHRPALSAVDDGRDDTGGFALSRLRILHADRQIGTRDLQDGRLIIGRTQDNDLQIQSRFVSRHHAQILTRDGQSLLEDLNSTNGVYLEGNRIKRRRLRHGDRIQLGEHCLVYEDLRDAAGLPDEDEPLDDPPHEAAEPPARAAERGD
jgi:general secretion pathway protein A